MASFVLELWSEQTSKCPPTKYLTTSFLKKESGFFARQNDVRLYSSRPVCSAYSPLSHRRFQIPLLFLVPEKVDRQCPPTQVDESVCQDVFDWEEQEKEPTSPLVLPRLMQNATFYTMWHSDFPYSHSICHKTPLSFSCLIGKAGLSYY